MYFIPYSTYKNISYLWRDQNNPQTSRILPRRHHAPGFEIPGSATVLDLKPTDFDHVNSKNAYFT